MRQCFVDFIKLTNEGSVPSKSGLYAERLPGITKSLFESLTKEEQKTVDEWWEEFYDTCVNLFISEISASLSGDFRVGKVFDSQDSGQFDYTADLVTDGGIRIRPYYTKYTEQQILSIRLIPQGSGNSTVTFEFWDKDNTRKLYEQVETLPNGEESEVTIQRSFDVEELNIRFSGATTIGTKSWGYDWENPNISGSITQQPGGMIVTYNGYCSVEKFICSRIMSFRHAFWNYIGLQMMVERQLNQNTNRHTLMTIEKAQQLAGLYQEQFDKAKNAAIKDPSIKDDAICFECEGTVRRVLKLP